MTTFSSTQVGEFLEASDATYLRTTPSGLTLLPIVADPNLLSHGFYAEAFMDSAGNIIIAFEGTTPPGTSGAATAGSTYVAGNLAADAQIAIGKSPQAFQDAIAFVQQVQAFAQAQHPPIPNSQIFLTGHSLGGAEAEAAGAVTGLAGVTFAAPGVTVSGTDPNLTDYVDYGDPIGNYGSETTAGKTYAPQAIHHIGKVVMTGSPVAGVALIQDVQFAKDIKDLRSGVTAVKNLYKVIPEIASQLSGVRMILSASLAVDLGDLAFNQLPLHSLENTYASDLGFSLSNNGTATLVDPSILGYVPTNAAEVEAAINAASYSSTSEVTTSGGQLQQLTATDAADGSRDVVNFNLSGGTSLLTDNTYNGSNQLMDTIQANTDGSEQDTVYNVGGSDALADQVFNYDAAGNQTSCVVAFTNGNSITFDAGTASGLSYNASTNTLTGTLMANGLAIGTFSIAAAGGGTVTLLDGPNRQALVNVPITVPATGTMHLSAASAGTSTGQIILNYLAGLGDTLTATQFDHLVRDTLSPPTSTTVVTGTINGSTDVFTASTENITAAGASSPVTNNYIVTTGHNLVQDTLSNFQTLDIRETSPFSNGILMTGAEFNMFQTITTTTGLGYAEVVDSGSYSMVGKFAPIAFQFILGAGSSQGTTLTGWNLAASMYGTDTLIAAPATSGSTVITLRAGKGVDTLEGLSAGGTSFVAEYGLAAGSVVDGFGSSNELFASGDISGATVTDVQTLLIGGQSLHVLAVTLTANQFNSFSTVSVNENLGGEIDVVGGGTVSLLASNVTQASFVSGSSLKAVSDDGTTLIGNNSNGITLTASQFGNDTLQAGSGNSDVLNGGGGVDTLIAGTGTDTLNAGGGYMIYNFGSSFGADTINNANGGAIAANGEIDFATSITLQKLWFTQSGNNLVIRLLGTSDTITVTGWFGSNAGAQVLALNTADGHQLSNTAVNALVTSMANYQSANSSFNPATATTMPTDSTLQTAMTTSWSLNTSSVTVANAQANQTALDAVTGGYTISDTAANIMAALAFLNSDAAHVSAIIFTDSSTPTLALTAAQFAADSGFLGTVTSGYNATVSGVTVANAASVAGHAQVTSITISDTAANVDASLDSLQTLAAAGKIASITLTDSTKPTITITSAQQTSDATVLSEIASPYNLVVNSGAVSAAVAATATSPVAVSDTSANVLTYLSQLQTQAAAGRINSIAFTDGTTPTLALTATQYGADTTVLGKMTSAYNLTVSGVSAANASTVTGDSHVTSITVSDTGANVVANIAALQTLATGTKLSSITLTDGTTPTLALTSTQLSSDAAVFGKITSAYNLSFSGGGTFTMGTGIAGVQTVGLQSASSAYNVTANNLAGLTITDNSATNDTIIAGNGGDTIVAGAGNDTLDGGNANTVYQFGTSFGQDTINNAFGGSTTAKGQVNFVAGLTYENLWFTQSGNNLIVRVLGSSDTVTLTGWFGSNAGAQVQSLTATGLTLSNTKVASLVSAMATYQTAHSTFNPATATAMPTDATLQSSMAVAWGKYDSVTVNGDGTWSGNLADHVGGNWSSIYDSYTSTSQLSYEYEGLNDSSYIQTWFNTGTGTWVKTVEFDSASNVDLQDVEYHTDGSEILSPGTASVAMTGGAGYNTYQMGSTFAQDTINNGGGATAHGEIDFASGITNQKLWLTQSGNDLVIRQLGTSSTITVSGWFNGTAGNEVQLIKTTDGLNLSPAAVTQIINAMAVYQAAHSTFNATTATTMPTDTTLQTAISNSWHGIITQTGVTVAYAQANQATVDATSGGYVVADTAANVLAGMSFLISDVAHIASVQLTDGTTPTLALTTTQYTADTTVLGKITSAYNVTVSAVTAANASTIAGNSHVTSLTVSDTAANFVTNIAALQSLATGTKLSSITLTDGTTPTLALTGTQYSADTAALGKITSAYNLTVSAVTAANASSVAGNTHVTSLTVSDTGANFVSNIAALQTLATGTKLSSIALTDGTTPTLALTASQYSGDTAALGKIGSSYNLSISGVTAANASATAGAAHVTSITVSDTAANMLTNITALQTLATGTVLSSIALTDGTTPTFALTASQYTADTTVLSKITSAYNVTVSGVTAANATATASGAHVTAITISDTAANVLANITALQTLATGTKLSSITLTDGTTPTLALSAAQDSADATVLGKITSAYNLTVSVVTAANASSVASQAHFTSESISDTAANFVSNISSLETLASTGKISSIVLTDSGTPTITITAAQQTADADALSKITSAYNLVISGGGAVSAATAATATSPVAVSDTAANVLTYLSQLQTQAAAGRITSIALTDSTTPTLALTNAQYTADTTVLSKITSAYNLAISGVTAANATSVSGQSHVTSVSISDTAANFLTSIAALQTLASGGKLSSVVLTDTSTPTISLTEAQMVADAAALSKISSAYNLTLTGGGTTTMPTGVAPQTVTLQSASSVYTLTTNSTSHLAIVDSGANGNDTINATAGDTVTISGNGQFGNSDSVTLSSGTVNIQNNARADVYGGSNTVTVGQNDLLGIQNGNNNAITAGTGTSVYVNSGTGDVVTATAGGVDVIADVSVSVSVVGGNNSVEAANGDTVSVSGNGQFGNSDFITMNSGTVNVAANARADIYGGSNTITTGATTLIGVQSGDGNTINLGANSVLYVNDGTNDVINGSGGEQYNFASAFGKETINNGTSASANGTAIFASGISDENLWFVQSGNDLLIDHLGTTTGQIKVAGWFGSNAGAKVQSFSANGLTLDTQVAQLVSAMATYQTAHSSFNPTTASAMPTDTTLQNAITAAWHS